MKYSQNDKKWVDEYLRTLENINQSIPPKNIFIKSMIQVEECTEDEASARYELAVYIRDNN